MSQVNTSSPRDDIVSPPRDNTSPLRDDMVSPLRDNTSPLRDDMVSPLRDDSKYKYGYLTVKCDCVLNEPIGMIGGLLYRECFYCMLPYDEFKLGGYFMDTKRCPLCGVLTDQMDLEITCENCFHLIQRGRSYAQVTTLNSCDSCDGKAERETCKYCGRVYSRCKDDNLEYVDTCRGCRIEPLTVNIKPAK